jgi:hypothetical protein
MSVRTRLLGSFDNTNKPGRKRTGIVSCLIARREVAYRSSVLRANGNFENESVHHQTDRLTNADNSTNKRVYKTY